MSSISMVMNTLPPVALINPFASMPMTPVSASAPTMTNRPAKNDSVVHSTFDSASSMLSPEISMMMPAAPSAIMHDSSPNAPCAMNPTTTRAVITTLCFSSRRFLICACSSSSMMRALCSSSTFILRPYSA